MTHALAFLAGAVAGLFLPDAWRGYVSGVVKRAVAWGKRRLGGE